MSGDSNTKSAAKWRGLVVQKSLLELGGAALLLLAPDKPLTCLAAALMLLGHATFWLFGAADVRVNDSGKPAPVPPSLKNTILKADCVLIAAASCAALAPWPAFRLGSATLFSLGISGVCLEKLAGRMKKQKEAIARSSAGES
eukprot:CAMPEP_0172634354 /NCGR_PEP_ID=MMETSP1068-20121228/194151_1 /TAXON_ID=35684 /ORGANISM="Pseudopedinella elastica, Strain CCMP716" /LENGTH=142 /DNA_ID=CAMNT_0013446295 /DNA_START=159 /DNA_END=587 /DNA_ORIENTATION=-